MQQLFDNFPTLEDVIEHSVAKPSTADRKQFFCVMLDDYCTIDLLTKPEKTLAPWLDQIEISSEKTNINLLLNSVRRPFGAMASTRIDVVLQLLEVGYAGVLGSINSASPDHSL